MMNFNHYSAIYCHRPLLDMRYATNVSPVSISSAVTAFCRFRIIVLTCDARLHPTSVTLILPMDQVLLRCNEMFVVSFLYRSHSTVNIVNRRLGVYHQSSKNIHDTFAATADQDPRNGNPFLAILV